MIIKSLVVFQIENVIHTYFLSSFPILPQILLFFVYMVLTALLLGERPAGFNDSQRELVLKA